MAPALAAVMQCSTSFGSIRDGNHEQTGAMTACRVLSQHSPVAYIAAGSLDMTMDGRTSGQIFIANAG